jgi:hypothetical protein
MSDVRVKRLYADESKLNDFLSLKDIELVKLHVRPMEYVIEYKKIKKPKGRPPTNGK